VKADLIVQAVFEARAAPGWESWFNHSLPVASAVCLQPYAVCIELLASQLVRFDSVELPVLEVNYKAALRFVSEMPIPLRAS
jgi:hypothetical protein